MVLLVIRAELGESTGGVQDWRLRDVDTFLLFWEIGLNPFIQPYENSLSGRSVHNQ